MNHISNQASLQENPLDTNITITSTFLLCNERQQSTNTHGVTNSPAPSRSDLIAGGASASQSTPSKTSPVPPSSVPLSPLPPKAIIPKMNNPSPRPTPIPPTLPPARAHGVHARPIARPGSSSSSPLQSLEDPRLRTPGPQPPSTLQAPKRVHQPNQQQQPRERTSATPVRSSVAPNTRPAPPPSRLSTQGPLAQASLNSSAPVIAPQSSPNNEESKTDRASSESNRDHSESTDTDESASKDKATKDKDDRPKKNRQRKVRKSLEKLTRRSIEKKRVSRQLKALTAISSPSSPTHPPDLTFVSPKRLSLWASIFGGSFLMPTCSIVSFFFFFGSFYANIFCCLLLGKVETKSGTDSMVRKGSTQSLNSLTSSPVSQDVSSSALKSSTSLSSEATSISSSSPRDSTDSAENEKSESKDPDPPSIDDISVVPHDRSRTLPAILPSGLLWSLSRVLGAKKTDVPLGSDTDTDTSDHTSDDDSQAEKSPSEATFAKADDALNISPTDTKTKSHPNSGGQQPPSKPERAALSARTNSRDRVVVSEAQVLIEDLDDENDPFTDSHALPNSIGASPASQFSVKDSLKQSTPSPSLSATTLSYLTGTSASGSTWSLQSSGQSLMKRIFKSKNEATLTEPTLTEPNTEQSTPSTTSQSSTGLRGSTSPSAVFAAPDPFSDFDQEFNAEGPEGLASVSTGSMKRRSFIIPGAFPGFGATQPEDGPEEPSEPKHVPMYSPSAGEVLVTARSEATKRRSYVVDDTDTWPNDEHLNASRSDGSHSPSDKPSLSPLESELPRYYPASPTRRPRAYSQHLTNPMLGVNSLNNPSLNQELHKDKPSTLVPGASRSPQPPKKSSSPKPKSSSSPSVLSIAQAPASLASSAPPSEEASSLLTPPIAPKDSSGVDSLIDGSESSEALKDQVLDSTIDYTRYKEEITESNYARYSWPSGEKPFETETQETDSSDMSESIVSSDHSSGSSPLIVEVISSGLRSSSQDHTSHSGTNAMSSVARPGTESQPSVPSVHSFHQSQLKNNPPPPPPPRNARRPRSKTLGKYPSREKIEADDTSSQSRSVSAEASSSNSPWDEPTMHAQAPAHVPHLTMVLTANATNPAKRPDIPGKEVIMEEMGSSEARNLIDADHQYYQSDKRRLEVSQV